MGINDIRMQLDKLYTISKNGYIHMALLQT